MTNLGFFCVKLGFAIVWPGFPYWIELGWAGFPVPNYRLFLGPNLRYVPRCLGRNLDSVLPWFGDVLGNIGIAICLGSGSSWTKSELILRLILDCILPRRNCLQRWYLLFLESPMLIFDLTILGRTQIWSQNESRIWYWKPSSTQLNSIGKPRPNKGETQFYTKETQILQRKPRYSFVIVYRIWYWSKQYQNLYTIKKEYLGFLCNIWVSFV